MDGTVFDRFDGASGEDNSNRMSPGMYFALFAGIAIVFAVIGMKYADAFGILEGTAYYGRYDGLAVRGTEGIILHANAAIMQALPCLMQLLVIYVLSFSPLLIPIVATVSGFRGFTAGIAYTAISGVSFVVQLSFYAIITLAMCFASAVLVQANFAHSHAAGRVLRKTVILTVAAGFAVICEFILSYIL